MTKNLKYFKPQQEDSKIRKIIFQEELLKVFGFMSIDLLAKSLT